jgi:FkbM family methyltransferase
MLPAYLTGDRLVLESVSRHATHAVRFSDHAILCRVLGKYLMLADADDYTVAPHMALDGYWEPWTTLAIARAVRPGTHAVDVGANHGYFTLLMAIAAGPSGRVMAIEPNPRLAALAAHTLEMNGVGGTTEVHACAAGDGPRKRRRLVIPPHHAADASLDRHAGEADVVLDVDSVTIDELTREWPRVDFVKIDAEGSEPAIWGGMSRTLEQNPAITVVLEFKPAAYSDPAAFLSAITGSGFSLRCIHGDGGVRPLGPDDALRGGDDGDWMLFLSRG